MVLMGRPVGRALSGANEIPVVKDTRGRQMENQQMAEDQRKREARDGNDRRLAPGETSPLEENLRQV